MNFISFIMPKLAWIIPLIILFFCFYVFMQNRLSSQEDKRISEHGDNIQATIVDISYDKDQRINNNFSAVIKVHYSYGGENIFSTRGVVFPASMQDKIKIGNKIGIRVNKNKPQSFYYLDYRNV
ncbi:DUF3592 domain-containing protein [Pluralibacter gergoviae]|uniref:DUF3592 domain-containing protein n=3 Tax=Pluralibacter gergoviae TaxID=61647 RepID=A0AAI9DIG9_PLUGE|nr:DUF3592 domain-containing protein [Pluralibacter gergoviae]AVR04183.1 DUF3592 domain-containing protein [Pluralibacter gergoviae]EKT9639836.1 DUF3592 domain-containing protein [Pluralibacter gergoviae]EKV0914292.1 DUF3592 domain-containing protein [Pluralibacter gergoviae]EKV3545537.1 DUF3592 domain-containing protein [Pluralibacter gergoviae]EKV9897309.1 DUF3592 domain-containing protein [Pluralibacter gergoviae]